MSQFHTIFQLVFLLLLSNPLRLDAQEVQLEAQKDKFILKQEKTIDSLKQLPFKNKQEQGKLLLNIIRAYRDVSPDSALVYAYKQVNLAQSLNDSEALARARVNVSSILSDLQRYDSAIKVLLINLSNKHLISDTMIAHTESSLSILYQSVNEYDKATISGLSAAEAFERINDSVYAGASYLSLARGYTRATEDYEKALLYIKKANLWLSCTKTPKEYVISARILTGDIYILLDQYKKALEQYEKAKALGVTHRIYAYNAVILGALGKVYYFNQQPRRAILHLERSLKAVGINNVVRAMAYKYLGSSYFDLGQPKKALSFYKLSKEYLQSMPEHIELNNAIIECYIRLGNFEKAFELQSEVMVYKDSVNDAQQKEKVIEITESYESDKKAAIIEQLNKEAQYKEQRIQQQNFIIGMVILFSIILGLVGYFWMRTQQRLKAGLAKLENAVLQQRFLRTQLNPHFFFHALSAIEGYIYTNEKKRAAAYLRDFSKLMRQILESSDQDFIPLQDELDMLREYLVLQQLNHDFKFKYAMNIAADLKEMAIEVPPMLMLPFLENSILHGAIKVEDGEVELNYTLDADQLLVSISDNGPGVTLSSKHINTLHRSMGTEIVQERIRNINELYDYKVRLSTAPPQVHSHLLGSSIIIRFPLRYIHKQDRVSSL